MMPVVLSILTILMFCISGFICFKLMRLNTNLMLNMGFCALIPVIGAIFLTCVIQILALVFPMRLIAPSLFFIFVFSIVYVKEIGLQWFRTILQNRYFLLIVLGSIILLQFPIIAKGELLSLQNSNNDIAFYLSSMEWLKSHSITDPVVFSSEFPFYSLADYMVNGTRFGTDLLGSFLMCIYQLQSHEVYYLYSGVLGTLTIFSAYFFMSFCLNVTKNTTLVTSLIFASGGLWTFLIYSQYAPQVFGITCLIAFTGIYLVVTTDKKHKGFTILASLLLVGSLTVYAEYAIYLFFIFIIITICKFFNKQTENEINMLILALKVGILSFILNPVGMFVAVKFNLNILESMMNDSGSIDAYSGRMMSIKQMISNLYGLPDYEQLMTKINSYGPSFQILTWGYNLLLIVLPLLSVIVIGIAIVRKGHWHKYVILSIMFFFVLNETYFRQSTNAYAEMKHITTISPFMILFLAYYTDGWEYKVRKINTKSILISSIVAVVFLMNIVNVYQQYKGTNVYYFDHSVTELRNAVQLVPPNEVIGITDSTPALKHSIVYALKDVPIKHNSVAAIDYSYFHSKVPYEFENTKYSIVSLIDYFSFLSQSEQVIWKNDRFVLLNVPTVAIRPLQGFYNLEQDGNGFFRWTSSNESELSLFNSTHEEQNVSISIDTEMGMFNSRDIKVYAAEKLIAHGASGSEINTDTIRLSPDESIEVRIISDGELNTVNTGDTRNFGFILRHVSVITK